LACKAQLQGAYGRSHGVLEPGTCWGPIPEHDAKKPVNWALCVGNRFGIAEWSFVEAVLALNRPRSKLRVLGFIRPTSALSYSSLGFASSTTIGSGLSVGLSSMVRWYSLENTREEMDIGLHVGISVSDNFSFVVLNHGIWDKGGFIAGWNLIQLNYAANETVMVYFSQLMNSTRGRTSVTLHIEKDIWEYAGSIRTRPFSSGFSIGREFRGINIRTGLSYQLLAGSSPQFELYQK